MPINRFVLLIHVTAPAPLASSSLTNRFCSGGLDSCSAGGRFACTVRCSGEDSESSEKSELPYEAHDTRFDADADVEVRVSLDVSDGDGERETSQLMLIS